MTRALIALTVVIWIVPSVFGEEAQSKIQITKAVKTRRAVEQAAVKVVVRGGNLPGVVVANVRKKVDPQDNVERVLLLTPQGPLVIEMKITLDGKPFRTLREAMVDDVLKLADTDGDGVPTWKEAQANKRLRAFRAMTFLQIVDQQRTKTPFISFDKNNDGKVDRYEARVLLASRGGGTAFATGSAPGFFSRAPTSASLVWDLLDKDNNGALSPAEIAGASERIQTKDKNDNKAVTLGELMGSTDNTPRAIAVDFLASGGSRGSTIAFSLGPAADFTAIGKALEIYSDALKTKLAVLKKDAPLLAHFVETIDANRDGKLDKKELQKLNSLGPHVQLTCGFAKDKPKVVVERIAAVVGAKEKVLQRTDDGATLLTVEGGIIQFQQTSRVQGSMVRITGFRQSTFAQLDKDKNDVLTQEEVKAAANSPIQSRRFDDWDVDSNGKVTKKEYEEFRQREKEVSAGRVRMSATAIGNRLFTALDANGDNQLGARELRNIAKKLKSMDKNADGKLASNEIPGSVDVKFSLAKGTFSNGVFMLYRGQDLAVQPAKPQGPEWFRRMDRNRDGDLVKKEFLGTPEQFNKIDTDKDGLIDPNEATASEKSK